MHIFAYMYNSNGIPSRFASIPSKYWSAKSVGGSICMTTDFTDCLVGYFGMSSNYTLAQWLSSSKKYAVINISYYLT